MGHLQSGGGDRRGAGAKSSRGALDAAECQLLPSAYDTTTVAVIVAASVRESLEAERADDCSDGGVHDAHGADAGGAAGDHERPDGCADGDRTNSPDDDRQPTVMPSRQPRISDLLPAATSVRTG